MNKKQENIFSMFLRVEARLDSNLTIVSSLPALAAARTNYKAAIAGIRATDIIATTPVTGVTQDKSEVHDELITACIQQSSVLCAYAETEGNNTLYQEVYKPESDIRTLRDDQLPTYAQLIAQRQTDHLADLGSYGVTAVSIGDFQALITLYTTASPTPRSAINTRKTAVAGLKTQFREVSVFLDKVVDKLVLTFKTTHPEFVEQYFNDRNIFDDGSPGTPSLLQTIQNTIAPGATNNEGPLPAGAVSTKITLIPAGPLEFGLSTDGMTFNGSTFVLSLPAETITVAISDFASAGNIILIRNQNPTVAGEYKIEIFG